MYIDNENELLFYNFTKNEVVEYRCKYCNKLTSKRFCVFVENPFICKTCNQKHAVLNKDWSSRYNKSKQTKLERYGNENYNNNEQTRKTCLQKYGTPVALNSSAVQSKIKQNNLQKYGCEYYFQSDIAKEKIKENFKNKSKDELNSIKEKRKQTCLERYGSEYIVTSDYFKNKSLETCLSHGYTNGGYSEQARHKIHKKYTYDGLQFDSKPELACYIFLSENNISFEYQPDISFEYMYDNKIHIYYPDFKINNQLTEIKGLQFFKDKNPNNVMINPFDRSMDDLYEAKHQCMLQNNVQIITDYSKFIDYVNNKYTQSYLDLFKNDISFPYPENDIIKKYHHSIYHANIKNKLSPYDAWQDKTLVKKCALNRLKYMGSCKPTDIVQGFNVAKIAPKVSVFKRQLAKHLIETYLNEFNLIFDPFSGFSGRMLGTCDCGKQYIGQDINQIHVDESNNIIKDLKLNAIVTQCDVFKSHGEYDCLFTCSPYNLKEIWNENETNLSCDEWIDICLTQFKCKKYLFVVDTTEKYKNNIVETIENKSHFGSNNEYVILIENSN